MGTFINLPLSGGSPYYGDPVASFATLPASGLTGEIRLTLDTGTLYYWTGSAWAVAIDASALTYLGNWNASTNTPTLADGTGNTGDLYRVNVAGTQNLGSGPQTFVVGDFVIYDGAVWQKSHGGADAVLSVNGLTGTVVLALTDIEPVTSGALAGAGEIGEILTATQATATATGVGATGTFGSATSLSLTAGIWRIEGTAGFAENGATLTTSLSGAISTSATGSGLTALDTAAHPFLISGSADLVVPVPAQLVNISSTTTYYLNTRFYYTAGTPQHYGRLTALRIR